MSDSKAGAAPTTENSTKQYNVHNRFYSSVLYIRRMTTPSRYKKSLQTSIGQISELKHRTRLNQGSDIKHFLTVTKQWRMFIGGLTFVSKNTVAN